MSFDILRNPDLVLIETHEGWKEMKESNSGMWNISGAELEINKDRVNSSELDIILYAPNISLFTVNLHWSINIDKQLLILGDHWERGYGDFEWRGIVPERIMPWYFLTYNGIVPNGYGVKTGCRSFCSWQLNAEGITLTVDIRCGNAGVQLGERKLTAATIVKYEGSENKSVFENARSFCKKMCERPILPASPVFGGNNWYYAYGDSSEKQILEDSKFIASLSNSHKFKPYMIIDDGWQLTSGGGGCNGGPWVGNYLFTDMEKLASDMKNTGVRPGIWCRPLLVSQNVPKEWVRYRDPGNGLILDPSVSDVINYVKDSISNISKWGYDLIKHDFTSFDILGKWGFEMFSKPHGLPYTFADGSKTTAEIILNLYKAIKDASNNSLIIGCNTISHLSAGIFEIQRTGDDTSGKSWERTRRMGINTLAFRMPQHENFYFVDADCIGVTSQIPWELNRQWLELLSWSGTPLFVSAEPAKVTKEQLVALQKAFEIAAKPMEVAEPLDWMYNTCPKSWKIGSQEKKFVFSSSTTKFSSNQDNEWWT